MNSLLWFSTLAILLAPPAFCQEERLPTNVWPYHEDVDIVINVDEGEFNYDGFFAINADVYAPYDGQIIFHAKELTVDDTSIVMVDPDTDEPYEVSNNNINNNNLEEEKKRRRKRESKRRRRRRTRLTTKITTAAAATTP